MNALSDWKGIIEEGLRLSYDHTILSRDQWNYWNQAEVASVWKIEGIKGIKIRSLTGSGLIDGNAIEYFLTTDDGTYPRNYGKAFVDIKNGSSDVSIENLTFKNVM
jgi:hypothetical protein